jgi:hypothetical protein
MSRIVAKFKTEEEAAFVRQMIRMTGLTERAFARIALINEAISVRKRIEIEVNRRMAEQEKKDGETGSETSRTDIGTIAPADTGTAGQ